MIQAIAHATDFSPASADAFRHAVRLAVEFRARLDLLHVKVLGAANAWTSFPDPAQIVAEWGMLPAGAKLDELTDRTGVHVRTAEIHHKDAISGIVTFLLSHRPDLILVATGGRDGLARWRAPSFSERVAREAHIPTLFFGPEAKPFVDAETGAMSLNRIVMPIAGQPSPRRAINTLKSLFSPSQYAWNLIHVGDTSPWIVDKSSGEPLNVELVQGPVIETILKTADRKQADLMAMPTAGHDGFLDALRGSTTERVLHDSRLPLLALPA